ncbi:hypothetical protein PHLGIDRAFT_117841 [Phlebiopsis gigantea 11061_1 CR5-6]|uniref:Uncharacterized protein n=1 Tax=Phlebiopsis gigantea (strain 11061_1 CR5-6) TaxID=745531 RepID=A0A0C3RZG9_PHLG1|nr:hypothetical protein PHLGIDRAFT_117841 [Phlebiopsis gigantea 11061_1 CR5-6]
MHANKFTRPASERLPQELFQLILDFILQDDYSAHFPDENIEDSLYDELTPCQFSSRELGLSSLVCKFWAHRLRQRLFQWIKLRSRERLVSFLELTDSTILDNDLQLGGLVEILTITQDPYSLPWFHLLTHLLPTEKLPNAKRNIMLDFAAPPTNQPLPSKEPPRLRSVFQDFPRSLPQPTVKVPHTISLTSLTFSRFHDLITFIASVVRWTDSQGYDELHWADKDTLNPYDPSPHRIASLRRTNSFFLSADRSDAIWPFVWVWTTPTAPSVARMERFGFPVYVVEAEIPLLATLTKMLVDERACQCVHCKSPKAGTMSVDPWKGAGKCLVFIGRSKLSQLLVACNFEAKDHLQSKPKFYGIDWHGLDALVAEFEPASLPTITLDIDTRWAEDMRVVVPFIRKRMPLLVAQRRLAFRFCRPRPSRREPDWVVWRVEPEVELADSDEEEVEIERSLTTNAEAEETTVHKPETEGLRQAENCGRHGRCALFF